MERSLCGQTQTGASRLATRKPSKSWIRYSIQKVARHVEYQLAEYQIAVMPSQKVARKVLEFALLNARYGFNQLMGSKHTEGWVPNSKDSGFSQLTCPRIDVKTFDDQKGIIRLPGLDCNHTEVLAPKLLKPTSLRVRPRADFNPGQATL
jgi:hypothetical protein